MTVEVCECDGKGVGLTVEEVCVGLTVEEVCVGLTVEEVCVGLTVEEVCGSDSRRGVWV